MKKETGDFKTQQQLEESVFFVNSQFWHFRMNNILNSNKIVVK